MFDNIKIKALEHKIKSMEKELDQIYRDIEGFKKEIEFYQNKESLENEESDGYNVSYDNLIFSLQNDIDEYKENARKLRIKIAFGKQKLEEMKKEKYIDIDTNLNL